MSPADLWRRLDRLEAAAADGLTVGNAIDRPPRETREQWLARVAGSPDLSLVNRWDETYPEWMARRQRELNIVVKGDADEHSKPSREA